MSAFFLPLLARSLPVRAGGWVGTGDGTRYSYFEGWVKDSKRRFTSPQLPGESATICSRVAMNSSPLRTTRVAPASSRGASGAPGAAGTSSHHRNLREIFLSTNTNEMGCKPQYGDPNFACVVPYARYRQEGGRRANATFPSALVPPLY